MKLLYRATRDGWDYNTYISKINGLSNVLSLYKAKTSGNVFGGYTD